MADVQVAYSFIQAVRKRRNETITSMTQAVPFHSVPLLVRFPINIPSVVVGVSDSNTDTTALVSPTPFPYSSTSSTGPLNQPTTQLDAPALSVASTSLAPTNLQYVPNFSSPPTQTLPPRPFPSEPVTISFAGGIPIAPLADSEPQEYIHSTSSSTTITKSPSPVTTETVLQEIVTISLSASGSDTNVNSRLSSVSLFLPTPIMNDNGSTSNPTSSGRPAAKAVGNVFSHQPTSGTPSSAPAIPLPLYPQQDLPLGLNPVAVVGCVLAGILSLTVVFFCIIWVLRSRRRLRDDKVSTL